jgi:hypothetical protein
MQPCKQQRSAENTKPAASCSLSDAGRSADVLPARRERPHRCRTTEKSDEVAPLHVWDGQNHIADE